MENVVNKLNQIVEQSKAIIEEMRLIRNNAYPLNDLSFMGQENRKKYLDLKNQLDFFIKRYSELFRQIPIEEQQKVEYVHIQWSLNTMLKDTRGLIPFQQGSDEYDIQRCFSETMIFGKDAVDALILAEKENNTDNILKARRILDACNYNFSCHFWGESRQNHLVGYEKRLREGRTIEDDARDYNANVRKAEQILASIATSIINGDFKTQRELEVSYKNVIQDNKTLLEFVPSGSIDEVNLYWKRLDMLKNPSKYIESMVKNESQAIYSQDSNNTPKDDALREKLKVQMERTEALLEVTKDATPTSPVIVDMQKSSSETSNQKVNDDEVRRKIIMGILKLENPNIDFSYVFLPDVMKRFQDMSMQELADYRDNLINQSTEKAM